MNVCLLENKIAANGQAAILFIISDIQILMENSVTVLPHIHNPA